MAEIHFVATTLEKYKALENRDENSLYFLDTGQLYKGDTLISTKIVSVDTFPNEPEPATIYLHKTTGELKALVNETDFLTIATSGDSSSDSSSDFNYYYVTTSLNFNASPYTDPGRYYIQHTSLTSVIGLPIRYINYEGYIFLENYYHTISSDEKILFQRARLGKGEPYNTTKTYTRTLTYDAEGAYTKTTWTVDEMEAMYISYDDYGNALGVNNVQGAIDAIASNAQPLYQGIEGYILSANSDAYPEWVEKAPNAERWNGVHSTIITYTDSAKSTIRGLSFNLSTLMTSKGISAGKVLGVQYIGCRKSGPDGNSNVFNLLTSPGYIDASNYAYISTSSDYMNNNYYFNIKCPGLNTSVTPVYYFLVYYQDDYLS